MDILIVAACLGLLFFRAQVWLHDHAKEITGCQHTKGKLVPVNPDILGRYRDIQWLCDDCRFQIPLKMRPVGVGWVRFEDVHKLYAEAGRGAEAQREEAPKER